MGDSHRYSWQLNACNQLLSNEIRSSSEPDMVAGGLQIDVIENGSRCLPDPGIEYAFSRKPFDQSRRILAVKLTGTDLSRCAKFTSQA